MNEVVVGLFAVVALVGWYLLARFLHNFVGTIFRGLWNFWFRVFSFIPFLGWMSHFIITTNEEEEEYKRQFQEESKVLRSEFADEMIQNSERKMAEQM